MGRPTDLTPEIADRVAQFIRAGNFPEAAAVAAGIPERTFYRWMARGQKAEEARDTDESVAGSEELFRQFWQQVRRAEAESEALAVGYLMKAMPTTPKAVIDWLERRFRRRWGRSERIEHVGEGGGPVEVEDVTEELIAESERIAQRLLAPMSTPEKTGGDRT